jgi:hypothetical protein
MSRGWIAVLAIAMAALACAGIALVSFVLARVVQEKVPLPQLHGRATPMVPARRPTLVVVGVKPSADTPPSFRGTALFLIDRHGFRRVGYHFPLQPNYVAPDLRPIARGRS